MSWLLWPFDTTGFLPRWRCGTWSAELGWTHILSDGLIWLAYLAIPALLLFFMQRRRDVPFPRLFWLFGAFIIACGTTHLIDALIFWEPMYRLSAVVKFLTAAISWATVLVLIPTIPRALAMRTPTELEKEIAVRTSQQVHINDMLHREVQERLRAESEIREQREWLQVILRSIGDGIVATDGEGRVKLLNPAAETLTGSTQDDAIGRPLQDVLKIRSNSRREVLDLASVSAADSPLNRTVTEQCVLIQRDGGERIVELQFNPIRFGDSMVAGVVLTIEDITDRIAAEESLRLQDRAISATNQGIMIADATKSEVPIVYASAGFERITGYGADEVLGLNCRFLQGSSTDPGAIVRIRKSLEQAVPCTVELINYRKDGSPFWNELSISPVRDERGRLTHFVGIQADISERKALEEQLRKSQQLESIGRLAGGVAHDFNNMLTIINGCSDLALDSTPPEAPMATLLAEIRSAGERASELTRQLLAFSRRQLISPQLLDVNEIVAGTEKMLGRLLGEDIQMHVTAEPQLYPVLADRGQLQQVLINLAINARDAMARGGNLSISTQNAFFDEEYVRAHPAAQFGAHVVLQVADSGNGLDEETRKRIFEPFFTTKSMGLGTGLGLAVVHGIVSQAGGHIEVASESGSGTIFRVCLPRAVVSSAPRIRHGEALPEVLTGNETILVVEDEQSVRAFIVGALAKYGYHVLTAADVSAAIELARDHRANIDLLITDVVMPGGSGSAVAEQILALHSESKVLFISGYTDDAVLRSGVIYEQVNFLDKPFTASVLARKVRETLER